MSTETVHRFRCDAPHCTASHLADNLHDVPEGWRVVKSTDHIPVPTRQPAYGARRRVRELSYTEQCRGSFTLHLCSDHTTVFDTHLPRTDGIYTRPGRDGQAYVSCSCGMKYVLSGTGWRVAAADMSGPSSYTENTWWRHLPTELQWYAARNPQSAR